MPSLRFHRTELLFGLLIKISHIVISYYSPFFLRLLRNPSLSFWKSCREKGKRSLYFPKFSLLLAHFFHHHNPHPSKPISFLPHSFQKRRTSLPFTKLNNVNVNSWIDGLTVASLKYDSVAKKMVTWRDTVKKDQGISSCDKSEGQRSPSLNRQRKGVSEVACKVSRSERLPQKTQRIECDKILSCGDILHKNPPAKIPLSKYSFKSKLNLSDIANKQIKVGRGINDDTSLESNTTITVRSSSSDIEDTSVDMDKRSSCNSVANAFEKLTISSKQDLRLEEKRATEKMKKGVATENCEIEMEDLESDSLVDISSVDQRFDSLDGKVLATRSVLDPFQDTRAGISDWFDGYVKKAESADCVEAMESRFEEEVTPEESCDENLQTDSFEEEVLQDGEEKDESNENLVLLFKSTTHLDLTNKASDYRSLRKDVSEETFETNCELGSIDLSYRKASYFSLKKSSSDICVGSVQSNMGLSSKNTLVSIYWNRDRETDEESTVENKRLFSSLPNVHFRELTFKKEGSRKVNGMATNTKLKLCNQRELLRRRILEIAAKEFVEDCHKAKNEEKGGNFEEPVLNFLEEEYTVPKKRRKMDSTALKTKKQKIFRFSGVQSFDLNKFKELTISSSAQILRYRRNTSASKTDSEANNLDSVRSEGTLCGEDSSTVTNLGDYSPRIFAILDNVLDNDRRRKLVVMTPSDCRRLIDLDREKLPELQRRLRKIKHRQVTRRRSGSLKLPPIENRGRSAREDKEIQVDGSVRLPRIEDRKLRRRSNGKRLQVDIKKSVGDVYLEYDSERWVGRGCVEVRNLYS